MAKNIYRLGNQYSLPMSDENIQNNNLSQLVINTSLPNLQQLDINYNPNSYIFDNNKYEDPSQFNAFGKESAFSSKVSNIGGSITSVANGIQGMVKGFTDNSSISDTLNFHTLANQLKSFNPNAYNNDTLMMDSLLIKPLSNPNWKTVRGSSTGKLIMGTVNSTMNGASAGASVGGSLGALIGAVVGLATGVAGTITGRRKAKREARRIANENNIAYNTALNTFDSNVDNVNKHTLNNMLQNWAAEGGPLDIMFGNANAINTLGNNALNKYNGFVPLTTFANGGGLKNIDFTNGLTYINVGGSHEQNPLGGVPIGVDLEGTPNMVELNEVIKDNYVFSDRLEIPKELTDKYSKLKKGDTYAKGIKKYAKESEERPNDPISKNGLEAISNELAQSQEEERMKKQLQNINTYACGGKKYAKGGLVGMYAPVISSFGDAVISLFEKPNNSYMNTVENYMFNIPDVGVSPTGNYMKRTPLDLNFYGNLLTANQAANRRALMNLSGGNRATQAANLLASDYNYNIDLGNASRQALEHLIANDMQVTDFNNKLNLFNTQLALNTQLANMLKRMNIALQLYNTQNAKNAERLRVKANKEAAIDNFTANISEVAKDIENRQMRLQLADSGVYGILNDLMKDQLYNYNFNKKNKKSK